MSRWLILFLGVALFDQLVASRPPHPAPHATHIKGPPAVMPAAHNFYLGCDRTRWVCRVV